MTNPLFDTSGPIAFDRITARDVVPAFDVMLAEATSALNRFDTSTRFEHYDDVLGHLERSTGQIEDATSWISHLVNLTGAAEMREAFNIIHPRVAAFYSSIPHHEGLWAAVQSLYSRRAEMSLSPEEHRALERTYEHFVRHGAALDAESKAQLMNIELELANETNAFAQCVVDGTDAYEWFVNDETQLSGLPESDVAAAAASARAAGKPGWRFTLQGPSYVAVQTYLNDRDGRDRLYRAYNRRGVEAPYDNTNRLDRILELRAEKARLLGYRDVSDLYLADRMVRNGETAQRFVDDLVSKTQTAFELEHATLVEFAVDHLGMTLPLRPSDLAYVAEKQRKARYDFDEEALKPYLSLDTVLAGLFDLLGKLYDVRFESLPNHPTWHKDASTYQVADAQGDVIGVFYLDLFPRSGKRGGAWMQPLRTGDLSGTNPHVAAVCCNFKRPVDGSPALLRHSELETLFHEFGHLMHHLLSEVSVRQLAGCNVAWDFVEFPSQIMENWCWEREALDLFARHYETDAPIPNEMFTRLQKVRTYRAASAMMRQLAYSAIDLALHRDYDASKHGSALEFARARAQRFTPVALPEGYAMIASFQHLFGGPVAYAAGYYSYKYAEVLEADAFTRFKNEGLFSRQVGGAFKDAVLARGATEDPMALFIRFMGREPDPKALLVRAGLFENGSVQTC
ncbi:MAG: M3 family metallopeptidase [Bradymonadia bacterium]